MVGRARSESGGAFHDLSTGMGEAAGMEKDETGGLAPGNSVELV